MQLYNIQLRHSFIDCIAYLKVALILSSTIKWRQGWDGACCKQRYIEPFDPDVDDCSTYTERPGQYFLAKDITDAKKQVTVLLTVIGKKAYALIGT